VSRYKAPYINFVYRQSPHYITTVVITPNKQSYSSRPKLPLDCDLKIYFSLELLRSREYLSWDKNVHEAILKQLDMHAKFLGTDVSMGNIASSL